MMFKNKTAVITGAAKGIGASCARLFHKAGAHVALLDIDEASSEFSDDGYYYINCDVSKERQVKEAFDEIHKKFGNIDYLVNNAGIQRYGTVTETTAEEWDLVFNINLKSQFLCAKYAIPYMLSQGRGVIINIASVQAFQSQAKVAAYTSAKAAILGLTRSIAIDYAPKIRCVAVCPGTIDTPMLRDAIALSPDPAEVLKECNDMHLLKRIGSPDEVAELVTFLCDDKASFITGEAIRIDGGLGIEIGGSKRD
jgi:NAD(P)-dependent dehydrogenase (short-subunit alcohol dehydrogenase family)